MSGVIYIAEQVGGRLVKIGWTKGCPKRRVQSLQTGSPKKLRLLGTIPAESVEDEKRLHIQFADLRVKGEWFRRSRRIMALVPREQKPSAAQVKKAKVEEVLNTYLRDSIRFGLATSAFTLDDLVRTSGVSLEVIVKISGSGFPDDFDDLMKAHSRALFKGIDRIEGGFPMRRKEDLLASELHRERFRGIKA